MALGMRTTRRLEAGPSGTTSSGTACAPSARYTSILLPSASEYVLYSSDYFIAHYSLSFSNFYVSISLPAGPDPTTRVRRGHRVARGALCPLPPAVLGAALRGGAARLRAEAQSGAGKQLPQDACRALRRPLLGKLRRLRLVSDVAQCARVRARHVPERTRVPLIRAPHEPARRTHLCSVRLCSLSFAHLCLRIPFESRTYTHKFHN